MSMANFDGDMREAQAWVEAVTGEKFDQPFAEFLRDGQTLCRLINKISPGSVRRINTSKLPFKQMENTANFMRAARNLGVSEHDCFETIDLYEGKDIGRVIGGLFALGRKAQEIPSFKGPHLGQKEAKSNVRKFDKAKWQTGHNDIPLWNKGNNAVMGKGSQLATSAHPLHMQAGYNGPGSNGWSTADQGLKGYADPRPAAASSTPSSAPPPPPEQ